MRRFVACSNANASSISLGSLHAVPVNLTLYGYSYCCAGLTASLLALGVMDLRVMAVVTTALTAERLAPAGERVARGVGVVGIVAGALLIARATGSG